MSVGVVPSNVHRVVSPKDARYIVAPVGSDWSTALRVNDGSSAASVESCGITACTSRISIHALSIFAESTYCRILGMASARTQRSRRIPVVPNQASASSAATTPLHMAARLVRISRVTEGCAVGVAAASISARSSSADW